MNDQIIIAGIGIMPAVISSITTYLMTKRKGKKDQEKQAIKLEYHPLFARMKAMQKSIETEFRIPNKGKEAIFREILIKKYNVFHDNLKKLAMDTDDCISICKGTDCNAIYNRNIEVLQQSLYDYNTYFQSSHFTEDERKCFDIVMQKFNKWHSQRVDETMESIEWICSNKFYSDCRTTQSIIFDFYLGQFARTINDADQTLNELNGDLKGLVFRGITL